jgi:hypothetical protein
MPGLTQVPGSAYKRGFRFPSLMDFLPEYPT